jgi:imidazolonepropionase-like amidohydrolase
MQVSHFLLDEIEAATEVAHQKGKRVCAHAGGPGTKMAIRGGVDCIEHGYFLDDEAVEMMVENDVFYVPTLVCNLDKEWLYESGMLETAPGDRSSALEGRILVAQAEGVDRAGMGEMEALIAATRTSADLCGVVGQLGTVEVGKLADLIVARFSS